jgi:hypothetical protein
MPTTHQTILSKKAALAEAVSGPLAELAQRCAVAWGRADALDAALGTALARLPHCDAIYAWTVDGRQISSLVTRDGADASWRGNDLSQRPYLRRNLPFKGIMLSSVYHSMRGGQPCITALQAVRGDGELLGFLAADFPVSELLRDATLAPQPVQWQQFRGDPAIRGNLFAQCRVHSLVDEHIDQVHATIADLIRGHGVFHMKIHYSSGRCSFWLVDDPYAYRIHPVNEIVDPDLCLAYPRHPYPERATVTPQQVEAALRQFKALRFADETIYLRSASLNIVNGMIGLTFSCDGSHYMPVSEFLERDLDFWFGSLGHA